MSGFDDPSVAFYMCPADDLHHAAQIDDNAFTVLDRLIHVLSCLLLLELVWIMVMGRGTASSGAGTP